jgi:hypothetical protein
MPTDTKEVSTHPVFQHMEAATKDLNLSEQEQNLYSMHLNNLYGEGTAVDHPDGSKSTLYQTVEQKDGQYYSIPTVWDGKIETDKWTRPDDGKVFDVANDVTKANVSAIGWDKFPSGPDPQALDDRYQAMHDYMERDTQDYNDSVSNTK